MTSEDKIGKIQRRYAEHKQVVLRWENAFMKTEGRQPLKSDLEQAPRNVRISYEGYQKYKKTLAKIAEAEKRHRERSQKNGLSTTPQKIFNGAKTSALKTSQSSSQSTKKIPAKLPKAGGSSFARNLSQKLFSIQKSSSLKPTKKSEDSQDSNGHSLNDSLNISGLNSVEVDVLGETFVLDTTVEGAADSFESITINDSQFDSEEDDVPVPGNLYTNFAADLPDNNSSSSAILNDELSQFSFGSSSNHTNGSDYSSLVPGGSERSVAFNQETEAAIDSMIEEDVRHCFSILNAVAGEHIAGDDVGYFPQAPFVLGSTLNTTSSNSQLLESQQLELCTQTELQQQQNVAEEMMEESVSLTLLQPAQRSSLKDEKENVESPAKRKYSFALSPSPEKEPKRKIFKSDRKTERQVSLRSCRPDIPLPGTTTPKAHSSTELLPRTPIPTYAEPSRPSTPVVPQPLLPSSTALESEHEVSTAVKAGVSATKKQAVKKRTVKSKTSVRCKAVKVSDKEGEDEAPPSSSSLIPVVDVFDIAAEKESKKRKPGQRRTIQKRKKGVNENYVSIDVAKKVFVRRKKTMTGAKMKRLEWKQKKGVSAREDRLKTLVCHKCNDIGHYSRFCPKGKNVTDETAAVSEVIDDSPWPTLEEAARMANSKAAAEAEKTRTVVFAPSQDGLEGDNAVSEDSQKSISSISQTSTALSQGSTFFTLANLNAKTTDPYLSEDSGIDADGLIEDDVYQALKLFGYEKFRPGQKEAVMRVLRGESTLLMLSTGSGKSLCYQLPAYMYSKKYPGTLTVCVSPLVSLMEDQVQGMPVFINAVCLHCNMTEKRRAAALESIRKKEVQILLVSPEALCGGLFGLFRDVENLPPIGFACIDEVHCVSEWSHNFRPSYLQVCKILREKLNIKTILGLTATATSQTCVGICDQLHVDPSTIIRGEVIPRNLKLSVSRDSQRDEALIRLLYSDRFRECESIIIYCTRREECNRVSELVRTHIRSNPKFNAVAKVKGRTRISNNCEAYHAGLTAARRSNIQKEFMQGNIRIVVATIAFGMGIDKSDIRAVIHYNMPSTFESYVQEIGRAGRDGLEANCHLFLDNAKGRDFAELKRHIFANFVDRVTIRKLISKIFKPCVCKSIEKLSKSGRKSSSGRCEGHEVSFSVNQTIQDLDLPAENIETLLCHLEVDKNRKWIELLPKTYEMCKIHSYGGSQLLKSYALKCPPLAVAIALQKEKKRFKDGDVYLEFNVVEAAASVGWNSAVVRRELKSLEWAGSEFNSQGKPTKFRKSGIIVEFCELAFRCNAPGDLTDKEFDTVLNSLFDFISNHERRELYQLHKVYQALTSVAAPTVEAVCDEINEESSSSLKDLINEYFQSDSTEIPSSWKILPQGTEKEDEIRKEVVNLLANYRDTKFTGRAVARIFQGINSPNFPAADWCRNRAFWRRFMDVDFHFISRLASEEIIANS